MKKNAEGEDDKIVIKPPKRRVRVPVKTGTVVHKSPKTYTRKEKHKTTPKESCDE